MSVIPVPLTTDVAPWLWYDGADPTMIRTSGSSLTEWYNKGTSGSLTNGTRTGTPTITTLNGLSTVSTTSANRFTTPSVTATANTYSIFAVTTIKQSNTSFSIFSNFSGGLQYTFTYNSATGNMDMIAGVNGQVITAEATIPQYVDVPKLYSLTVKSSASYFGVDGSSVSLTRNDPGVGTISTSGAKAYGIFMWSSTYTASQEGAEILVYMGDITATQRQQIEGYLAWKWGLQANLPTTHPYSVANKAATMALYSRPHGFTTVFVSGLTGARGVVCDSASNLYVARGSGNDIRKYNAAGTLQWTVSTVGGVACNNPAYIARDASDNIYVAETTGQRIVKITAAGSASVFKSSIPVGPIAVDSVGAVYYHDTTALNIKKITADGATTTTFNTGQASTGLVCDASDNIYASHNYAITKISSAGSGTAFVGTAGSTGSTDAIGTDARFNNDANSSLSIDSRGYIYVAENSGKKIRMISPAGAVLTITGLATTTTPAAATDNGIDINARYNSATGVAAAADGSVYIADMTAGNIRKISPGVMNQVGTYTGPTANGGTYAFSNTIASVYMPDGSMYLGDGGNSRIMKILPSGVVSTFRAGRPISAIAIDNYHNLYLAYWGTPIYKYTPAGLETQFASAVNGYGLEVDANNNIYFVDLANNRIRKYTPDGTVSTFAGSGANSSIDGTGTGASFSAPIYIARGPSGNFYVTDYTGNKIRKITPGGVVTTLAGSGSAGSVNGTGATATFELPIGIAVDSSENVYVSVRDSGATIGRVRMITPDGVVSTIAGGGAGTNTDGVGTAASFHGAIYDIDIDQHNNIFVADQSNYKFRMIARNATPSGSVSITGTLTQGQTITADTSALVDVNGFGTLSYAWYSSSTAGGVYTAISGATSSTLTLAEAQVAKYIKVIVSYTDGRGTAESVSSAAVGAIVNVNDTAVGLDISGTLAAGSTLSAITANIVDPDGNAPPYTYQWSSSTLPTSGFSNISGATSSTYVLTLSEVDKYIRLTVSYTNNYGAADSAVATTASTVVNPNSPVSGTLSITGSAIEGYTLTADTSNISDEDGLGVFTYKWLSSATSNGTFIEDASGSSTVLTSGQAGRYIKLEVTYVDGKGNSEYIASSVVGPVIAATAPSAPQDASASPVLLGATLSWSVPADDGYSTIQGYRVYDGSGVLVVDTSGLTYALSNLPPSVSYTYSIKAYNAKGESGAATATFIPVSPTVTELGTGQIPETFSVPVVIAGTTTSAKKLTPDVSGSVGSVSYDPEPGVKAAVTVANIPAATVSKVVVATAAPLNGYTTLKVAAFNSSEQAVTTFASPLSITLSIPGYTAASLIVRTYATVGGAMTDSVIATQNQDGTYTLTLSHLTYLRVSQNIPCFVAGTKILTAAGYKAVEEIAEGELVATSDGRALPCKVYTTEVDETTKENAPYVIPANTFAPRCPARDLTLSPLHAIQLTRGVWQIPKMAATLYSGVRQMPVGESITYYHLEMPNYLTDNIVAEGTVVESYGARQLAGRRVEYKFNGAAGGFIRTITEARTRGVAVKRA